MRGGTRGWRMFGLGPERMVQLAVAGFGDRVGEPADRSPDLNRSLDKRGGRKEKPENSKS
jgi:hypothetical protein